MTERIFDRYFKGVVGIDMGAPETPTTVNTIVAMGTTDADGRYTLLVLKAGNSNDPAFATFIEALKSLANAQ